MEDGTYKVDLVPLGYCRQPKDEAELRAAVKVVLGALKELHGRGFVHRDIRWENILHSGQVSETLNLTKTQSPLGYGQKRKWSG